MSYVTKMGINVSATGKLPEIIQTMSTRDLPPSSSFWRDLTILDFVGVDNEIRFLKTLLIDIRKKHPKNLGELIKSVISLISKSAKSLNEDRKQALILSSLAGFMQNLISITCDSKCSQFWVKHASNGIASYKPIESLINSYMTPFNFDNKTIKSILKNPELYTTYGKILLFIIHGPSFFNRKTNDPTEFVLSFDQQNPTVYFKTLIELIPTIIEINQRTDQSMQLIKTHITLAVSCVYSCKTWKSCLTHMDPLKLYCALAVIFCFTPSTIECSEQLNTLLYLSVSLNRNLLKFIDNNKVSLRFIVSLLYHFKDRLNNSQSNDFLISIILITNNIFIEGMPTLLSLNDNFDYDFPISIHRATFADLIIEILTTPIIEDSFQLNENIVLQIVGIITNMSTSITNLSEYSSKSLIEFLNVLSEDNKDSNLIQYTMSSIFNFICNQSLSNHFLYFAITEKRNLFKELTKSKNKLIVILAKFFLKLIKSFVKVYSDENLNKNEKILQLHKLIVPTFQKFSKIKKITENKIKLEMNDSVLWFDWFRGMFWKIYPNESMYYRLRFQYEETNNEETATDNESNNSNNVKNDTNINKTNEINDKKVKENIKIDNTNDEIKDNVKKVKENKIDNKNKEIKNNEIKDNVKKVKEVNEEMKKEKKIENEIKKELEISIDGLGESDDFDDWIGEKQNNKTNNETKSENKNENEKHFELSIGDDLTFNDDNTFNDFLANENENDKTKEEIKESKNVTNEKENKESNETIENKITENNSNENEKHNSIVGKETIPDDYKSIDIDQLFDVFDKGETKEADEEKQNEINEKEIKEENEAIRNENENKEITETGTSENNNEEIGNEIKEEENEVIRNETNEKENKEENEAIRNENENKEITETGTNENNNEEIKNEINEKESEEENEAIRNENESKEISEENTNDYEVIRNEITEKENKEEVINEVNEIENKENAETNHEEKKNENYEQINVVEKENKEIREEEISDINKSAQSVNENQIIANEIEVNENKTVDDIESKEETQNEIDDNTQKEEIIETKTEENVNNDTKSDEMNFEDFLNETQNNENVKLEVGANESIGDNSDKEIHNTEINETKEEKSEVQSDEKIITTENEVHYNSETHKAETNTIRSISETQNEIEIARNETNEKSESNETNSTKANEIQNDRNNEIIDNGTMPSQTKADSTNNTKANEQQNDKNSEIIDNSTVPSPTKADFTNEIGANDAERSPRPSPRRSFASPHANTSKRRTAASRRSSRLTKIGLPKQNGVKLEVAADFAPLAQESTAPQAPAQHVPDELDGIEDFFGL